MKMEVKSNRLTKPSNLVMVIPYEINAVLDYLAKNNKLEWQCFAEAEELVGNKFRINNLVFPGQTNTSGTTSSTEAEYAEAVEKMDDEKIFCWIHSHNTMSAFWSHTDYEQMDRQSADNGMHTLSLVVSAKNGKKAALNMYRPVKDNFDMEIEVEYPKIDEKFLEEYQERLDEVQTIQKYTYTKSPYQVNNSYQQTLPINSRYNYTDYTDYTAPMADKEVMEAWDGETMVAASPETIKALERELKKVFKRKNLEYEKEDLVNLVDHYQWYFNKNTDTIYKFVETFTEYYDIVD